MEERLCPQLISARRRAPAPSSMKPISAISGARSAPSGNTTSHPAAAGGHACERCSPSWGRVSSSWSATTMPARSAPIARPGRTMEPACFGRMLLLIPVLYVNQEMVLRLGAVTGVGHARLILERFGRFWGAFSVIDLFLLNALTIVTEFIGISLALDYLGVPTRTRGDRFCRDHHCRGRHRRFPPLRAVLAAVGLRQPAADPGVHLWFTRRSARSRTDFAVPQLPADGKAERGDAADHRHRRHHGGAVAAFLPAELCHRQAHHAALHALRARRPVDRHRARDRRRGRDDGVAPPRPSPGVPNSAISRMPERLPPASASMSAMRRACCSPSP